MILIFDCLKGSWEEVTKYLENLGHTVHHAEDLNNALEYVQKFEISFVLMRSSHRSSVKQLCQGITESKPLPKFILISMKDLLFPDALENIFRA